MSKNVSGAIIFYTVPWSLVKAMWFYNKRLGLHYKYHDKSYGRMIRHYSHEAET